MAAEQLLREAVQLCSRAHTQCGTSTDHRAAARMSIILADIFSLLRLTGLRERFWRRVNIFSFLDFQASVGRGKESKEACGCVAVWLWLCGCVAYISSEMQWPAMAFS